MAEAVMNVKVDVGEAAIHDVVNRIKRDLNTTMRDSVYHPQKIIRSNDVTIVFWKDDTKTIVRCQNEDLDDDYTAFCAALGKKVFGSNSALKKVIKKCLTVQPMTDYRMRREREKAEVELLKRLEEITPKNRLIEM